MLLGCGRLAGAAWLAWLWLWLVLGISTNTGSCCDFVAGGGRGSAEVAGSVELAAAVAVAVTLR